MFKPKKSFCPWCGQKVYFRKERRFEPIICDTCSNIIQHKIPKNIFGISFSVIIILLFAVFFVGYFLGDVGIAISCVTGIILILVTLKFNVYFTAVYRISDWYGIIPHDTPYKAKITFSKFANGGVFSKKFFLQNGFIRHIQIETDNKKVKNEKFAMPFESVRFDKNVVTCRCGIIHKERLPEGLVQKGVKFTIFNDKEKPVATGVITDTLENPEN